MISHAAFLLLAAGAVEQIPLSAEESVFLHQLNLDFEAVILRRLENRIPDRMDAEDQAQECMLRLAKTCKNSDDVKPSCNRARYITHTVNSVISDYWADKKTQEKHFPQYPESEDISDRRTETDPERSVQMKDDVAAFCRRFSAAV